MLTPLRQAAKAALLATPVSRKPALRRADDPAALLATDLPLIAQGEAVAAFMERMEAMGWHVWRAGDWLLMDAGVPVPETCVPARMTGEAGCCISLLARHPNHERDQAAIRAVVKAAESGEAALERVCKRLHAEWATALREHRDLPGGLLPYLCRAIDITQGGNPT